MEPRLLFRTHYQVDEPVFAHAVITLGTSAIRSNYDENVARLLAREITKRGKKLNIAAAGYAVDLAKGLSLVGSNNIWEQNGHLVALLAPTEFGEWDATVSLDLARQLLYFRIFFEADGAALLYLARRILREGCLPHSGMDWNALATEMFVETYSAYLAATTSTPARVALRSKIDALRMRNYAGKSGSHKIFLHLQTLYRLGLVDRAIGGTDRRYEMSDLSIGRLQRLVAEIPDIYSLETMVQQHSLVDVSGSVYDLVAHPSSDDPQVTLRELIPAYRRLMATGVSICPLAPIVEATQIKLLVEDGCRASYSKIVEDLQQLHRTHIGQIRFHQDRLGRVAYLRLADTLIEDVLSDGTASAGSTMMNGG